MVDPKRARDAVLEWLLEPDNPGVRYLALRDLTAASGRELAKARKQAHAEGPIAKVLAKMKKGGYWEKPGPGYNPKYKGTVWSMILLSQLGASVHADERVAVACSYVLDHALTPNGQFTMSGAPSGTIDCLQGNLGAALLEMGCQDPRLDKAFEWMARSVTGEGVASMQDSSAPLRYYTYKCGPGFACSANDKLPCAWGAVKVMLAFGKLPANKRSPLIQRAIDAGVEFLFSCDPAQADYPTHAKRVPRSRQQHQPSEPAPLKPSRNWWKFGFPVFYVTDLLQNVEALVALGYGDDRRLAGAWDIIWEKQDPQGRWALEYDYRERGRTWMGFGAREKPNKWVTLRALRVLNS